jgi:hypothetical protein
MPTPSFNIIMLAGRTSKETVSGLPELGRGKDIIAGPMHM